MRAEGIIGPTPFYFDNPSLRIRITTLRVHGRRHR